MTAAALIKQKMEDLNIILYMTHLKQLDYKV